MHNELNYTPAGSKQNLDQFVLLQQHSTTQTVSSALSRNPTRTALDRVSCLLWLSHTSTDTIAKYTDTKATATRTAKRPNEASEDRDMH
jgi:hypothetical protein